MSRITLRAAGWQEGDPLSDLEAIEEQELVRRFLMQWGAHYLPGAFRGLSEMLYDSRMLIAEQWESGKTSIVGCVGYAIGECVCAIPMTNESVASRFNLLRLLAVREGPDRSKLAIRLLLEAMLRGTIRSRHDDEDRALLLGTIAVILERNARALKWAANLGSRVRLLRPEDPRVEAEPALQLLRDFADGKHRALGLEESYRIAVANRTLLRDAAILNLLGRPGVGRPDAKIDVHYDLSDPYRREIETAVANIVGNRQVTLSRLGLTGDEDATIWGPPAVPEMRIRFSGGQPGWADFTG